VAGVAESHVVDLILDQQIWLCRGMGLVAGEATEGRLDLALIGWIQDIGDRVILDRMAQAVFQGQNDDLVLCEVVLREFDLAVKDADEVFILERL
jgi:hypothetical protein